MFMRVSSFYPVIMTDQVEISSTYYQNYFNFEVVYEADWYTSLKRVSNSLTYELAILNATHTTIPEEYRKSVQGIILNFEVADVDIIYDRLITELKLPLIQELRDEEFGQRHFITEDPNGILIDVITVVPPSAEETKLYKQQIWNEE